MKYTIRKITALIVALMLAMPGVVTADETIAVDGGAIVIDDAGLDIDSGPDLVLDGDGFTVEDFDGLLSDGANGLALDGLNPNFEDAGTDVPASFEQTVKAGDVAFTVTAGAGAFPEDSSLRVSDILDETLSGTAVDAAENMLPGTVKRHRLYQIEVIGRDGKLCAMNGEMALPSVCVEGLDAGEAVKIVFYDPVEKQGREIEIERENEKVLRFGFVGSGVYDVVDKADDQQPVEGEQTADVSQDQPAGESSTDQKPSPVGEGGASAPDEVSTDSQTPDETTDGETEDDASTADDQKGEQTSDGDTSSVSPDSEPASPQGEASGTDDQSPDQTTDETTDGESDTPDGESDTTDTDTSDGDTAGESSTDDQTPDGESDPDDTDTSTPDEIPSDTSDTPGGESDPDTPTPLPVAVIFTLTPGDAQITVRPVATEEAPESDPASPEADGAYDLAPAFSEADGANPISPEADGTYLLIPGEYAYAASAEGYIAVEDVPFTVEASGEPLAISVTLEPEPEPEPEPVPFDQTVTVNGVAVTVRAGAGAFPANAVLWVKRVPSYKVKQAGAAIDEIRDEDQNVAVSYTFDIKVVDPDTNKELQPAEGFNVEVSFALSEANDENLEASVYHVTGENGAMTAEKLDADVDETAETVTATSDGFSIYTVEFTYGDLQYVLRGGGRVTLSKILAAVGLSGTAADVEVSNEALFSASPEGGDWIVESHKPFDTAEWMRVTVGDIQYTIDVTDDSISSITYIDENCASRTCASTTVVDSSTEQWTGGTDPVWYAVTADAEITGRINVSGDVRLVLCDGKKLTASKGIHVTGSNKLTIYAGDTGADAEVTGDGALTVNGVADNNAGIGGDKGEAGGHIIVNGGEIATTGGDYGAGIGGGNDSGTGGDGGNITINGGTVNATGGGYAAGIGGGSDSGTGGAGGNITINSGHITATGGGCAAGIGGGGDGTGGDGGTITIRDSAKVSKAIGNNGGAGIGGGCSNGKGGAGGTITVSGGTVTAKGSNGGAGIGGGGAGIGQGGSGGTITVSGGTVTATGDRGAGIGGGAGGSGGNITVSGGTVTATGGSSSAGIGDGKDGSGGNVSLTWTDETKDYMSVWASSYAETVTVDSQHPFKIVETDTTINSENIKKSAAGQYIIPSGSPLNALVPYVDAAGKDMGQRACIKAEDSDSAVTWGAAGKTSWYAVTADTGITGRIAVSGSVNLILCDGATLTAAAGITVAKGDSLTVWAQAGQTGALAVSGAADYNAGIGGGKNGEIGHITVNGGEITAKGSRFGAGIGGGDGSRGTDSRITVNGGTVHADGGENGAGIGSGQNGGSCTITVSDGTVFANGGDGGAGIGGGAAIGPSGDGGTITVSGGTITANGGGGAGIGGGYYGAGGKITLNYTEASRAGMSVTASSYRGTVKLKDAFQVWKGQDDDGHGAVVGATAGTNAQVSEAALTALAGRTLVPFTGTACGIAAALDPEVPGAAVAITVDGVPVTQAVKGTTVTLTVPKTGSPEACQYGLSTLKAVGAGGNVPFTATDTEGVYTFQMPETGVTATFTMWAKLQEQIDAAAKAQGGGTVKLGWDVTATEADGNNALTIPGNKSVTIDMNGKTIDRGLKGKAAVANGSVITVNPGASLTVTDTSTNGHGKITGGNNTDNGGGVYVNGGSFTLSNGEIITNNASGNGGGVYVNGGTFEMTGGVIGDDIVANTAQNGGGVYLNGDSFTMSDGTILGNKSINEGGGVYVGAGSRFTMTGGAAICENQALGTSNTDGHGGGVYVKGGSFTMSGGVIGGTDRADANIAYCGGGVYVKGGSVAMSGGAILGNTAKDSGGGVYVKGGAFRVSGAPTVTGNEAYGADDNVCLPENMTITVADALTEGASIGVYVGVNGKGKDITTDYAKHNGGDEPSKYFTSDEEDYVVGWNDGFDEAVVGKAITCGATAYAGDYDGIAHDALSVDLKDPTSDATVTYSADGETFGSAAPTVTDAGDHAVYYRVTASGYAGVRGTAIAKIAPIDAAVTITGNTNTAPYDGKAHKVEGYDFKASTPLYTEADCTFSGKAEATRTDAGTATMGLKADQFANSSRNFRNVTFNVTDGWHTIEPYGAVVTVTVTGKTNTAPYDGKAHKIEGYDFKASTPLYTEADCTFSGKAEATQTGVGTAAMGLKATQFANSSKNFKSVVFNVTDGWQEVERAVLTVTADAVSKTYGDKDPAMTYKVDGLLDGDSLSGSLEREAGEDVGSYDIKQGTLKATDNYVLTFTGAKFTIDRKALTVTADAKGKIYGEVDPALTYKVDGLLDGDSLSGSLERDAGEDAGSYEIKQGTLANPNYDIAFTGAKFTIDRKAATVTADAKGKTYGDTDPALTYVVNGLLDGDSLSGKLTREAGEDVGSYEIKQGTLKATDNYDLTFTGAALTVSPAAVTVAADAKSKTYGNRDPKLTAKVSGLKNGDPADAIKYTLTRAKEKSVGSYAITVTGETVQGDYAVTYEDAKLTVRPRPLTVTAAAKTKKQGEADPKLTYTVKGLLKGDKLTGKLSRKPGEAPGKYAITRGTLKASRNYKMIFKGATLTIVGDPTKPDLTERATTEAVGDDGVVLAWTKVNGAYKYDVFFKPCDSRDGYTLAKSTKELSCEIDGLEKGKSYKAYVRAWKWKVRQVGKKKTKKKAYIGKPSPMLHFIAGGYSDEFCNPKAVTVKRSSITLRKGRTGVIEAGVIGVRSDRDILDHEDLLRYYSSDTNVAQVLGSGLVKAVGKGSCEIIVMAVNGVSEKVRVRVK